MRCLSAIIFTACFLVLPLTCGDIANPSFEFYDPNGGPCFPTAIDWEHENYAADANFLIPLIEPQDGSYGKTINWLIDPESGLPPKDGERLLMLSTGNIDSRDLIYHSKAWQESTFLDGDRLSGYYFFGTCDYTYENHEYNDYATISLINNLDPNSSIPLININVEIVGKHSSLPGWERFEYRFNEATAGTYDLTFFVTDVKDDIVNSYLGVDALEVCQAPEYGDINLDCRADNLDFAIISNNWLVDCTGPSESWEDPNDCYAWLNTGSPGDIDKDDMVNMTDLRMMVSGWLDGEQP